MALHRSRAVAIAFCAVSVSLSLCASAVRLRGAALAGGEMNGAARRAVKSIGPNTTRVVPSWKVCLSRYSTCPRSLDESFTVVDRLFIGSSQLRLYHRSLIPAGAIRCDYRSVHGSCSCWRTGALPGATRGEPTNTDVTSIRIPANIIVIDVWRLPPIRLPRCHVPMMQGAVRGKKQ